MLTLPSSVRIFLAMEPTDMRRSFDGLAAITRDLLGEDPTSTGHLYVFRNKRNDRIKVLFWSRNGLVIFYKRIEGKIFHFPDSEEKSVEVEAAELAVLIEGLDLSSRKRGGPRRQRSFALR